MKAIHSIVYSIQYLTTFLFDLQEIIYNVKKTYFMSAGEVGLGELHIDVFLEVQDNGHS